VLQTGKYEIGKANDLPAPLHIFLFLVAPTLEHSASVKHFVSLQFLTPKTVGETPWTGNQPVVRPLPTHKATQTEQTYTDIHALSGIRIHDPTVQAGEDSSCLRPRGHCDRPNVTTMIKIRKRYIYETRRMREMRNELKFSLKKPQGKRSPDTPTNKNGIKMCLV
jgi:hypothetical protein